MMLEEFMDRYTTKEMMKPVHDDGVKVASNASFSEGIPVDVLTRVDWRSQGAVTPIKSLGQCGTFVCNVSERVYYFGISELINLVLK
jgi:hypothetical protein